MQEGHKSPAVGSCRHRAHLDPSAPGLESEGGWHYGTVLSTSTSGGPAAQNTAPFTGSLSVAASTAVPVGGTPGRAAFLGLFLRKGEGERKEV